MRERFTDEEWGLVRHVPWDAFILVSLADKNVEEAEVTAFTETLDRAVTLTDPLHREIALEWAQGGLEAMGDELRFEMTEKADAMRTRFDRTKAILKDKLTRDEYQGFVLSVTINGLAVAAAAGGKKKKMFHKEEKPISEEEAGAVAAFATMFDVDMAALQARLGT